MTGLSALSVGLLRAHPTRGTRAADGRAVSGAGSRGVAQGFAVAAVILLTCGGCATQKGDWGRLKLQSLNPDRLSSSQLEVAGLTALAWNDDWTAARLLEAAARKRDVPLTRFNLATAYERVGRVDAAAALYSTLLDAPEDNRFVYVEDIKSPLPANNHDGGIGAAARARLDRIQQSRPLGSVGAIGASSSKRPVTELFAAPVSASEALARDEAAGGGGSL